MQSESQRSLNTLGEALTSYSQSTVVRFAIDNKTLNLNQEEKHKF